MAPPLPRYDIELREQESSSRRTQRVTPDEQQTLSANSRTQKIERANYELPSYVNGCLSSCIMCFTRRLVARRAVITSDRDWFEW